MIGIRASEGGIQEKRLTPTDPKPNIGCAHGYGRLQKKWGEEAEVALRLQLGPLPARAPDIKMANITKWATISRTR